MGQEIASNIGEDWRAFLLLGRLSLKALHPAVESEPSRLLIVDDDLELLQFLMEELSSSGHQCFDATTARTPAALAAESFDLVVLIGPCRFSAVPPVAQQRQHHAGVDAHRPRRCG